LFVLSLVELIFASILQGAVAIVLLFATRSDYTSLQEAVQALPSRLMEPPIFILMLVLSASSIIAGAFLFGWISAKHCHSSIVERLGLRWPKISTMSLVSLLLGSIPVLLVSVGVVILINAVLPGDESVLMLYKNITNGWAIVFIVLIGVLPGFGEELFFRGFLQRRMLKRFRPSVAIGVTSLVFGLFHVTPHGIALATIIGVWLGVIAWRTNSIWPSACCHAFVNSGWNVYQVGRFQWGFPDVPPVWFCVIGGTVVLAAFVWSVRILFRSAEAEIVLPAPMT
jgi:membrane protease YdiL (CAAX protease family)